MSEPVEIDALGLLCPLPVLRLSKRLLDLPSGTEVALLADDPIAQIDVPHFCAEAGHEFLGMEQIPAKDGDRAPHRFRVRRG